MEFVTKDGTKFDYWFTAGTVVKARSWIYRQQTHYDIWIRDDDGREWHTEGGLLGVAINHGQRLAFAWCSPAEKSTGKLVAVRNCTTGECRVKSNYLAGSFTEYRYGRWLMLAATAFCLAVWQGGLAHLMPNVVQDHPVLSGLALVAGLGFLGFCVGAARNPDPEGVLDQNIQVGLQAMETAWREQSREEANRRPRRRRA